jgi:D-xylose transport system substrate-binding protein
MRKRLLTLVAVVLLAAAGIAGCTKAGASGEGGGVALTAKIGVILPDTTSSPRWTTYDPPFLQRVFDAAKLPVSIENAHGDKARFAQLADQMIAEGVKVLMIVSLDPDSGGAVLKKARDAGIKTIDYDRLTLGGGADYHVSFDNVQAGVLMGNGLADCLRARHAANPVIAELNGPATDNNATMFKTGYDSVLQTQYDSAAYVKGPGQEVPGWNETEAAAIFEQMLNQQPKIGGVLAANDGLARAVIGVLAKHGLNGKVPVTGQDATIQSLRDILTGDQCMTVYRAVKPEADAAANLAVDLYHGWKPTQQSLSLPEGTNMSRVKDPVSGAYVPYVGLAPQLITVSNMQMLINDSFVLTSELCGGEPYARLCRENGIGLLS